MACSSAFDVGPGDVSYQEGGVDATSANDAAVDDVARETVEETGAEARAEASLEAGIEASAEAGTESGSEAGHEGGLEAGVDAGGDAEAGVVCPAGTKSCSGTCRSTSDPAIGCADPKSCAPCAFANAAATCDGAGACSMGACAAGYADCNGSPADGCEVPTATDVGNCGACNAICATACGGGHCLAASPTPHVPHSVDILCTNGSAYGACPTTPNQTDYGQDGCFTANVPKYVTTPTTVYDPVSGLMWERVFAQGSFTLATAQAHCASIAAASFAGFADWRVPTAFELMTLADLGRGPLPPSVFSSQMTNNTTIFSASASVTVAGGVYGLGSNWGDMAIWDGATAYPTAALCVRGTTFAGAMTVSSTGNVVVDSRTSLAWQRAVAPGVYTWSQALAYCNALALDGLGGWRLPSYKELWSTIDVTKANPAVDTTLFPGTPSTDFWTSTVTPNNFPSQAYVVTMGNGAGNAGGDISLPHASTASVRCVHGG